MIYLSADENIHKGWLVGPWNSELPVPIGYAHVGLDEEHYHAAMYEVYLIARGWSIAVVKGEQIRLAPGDVLVVAPREVHTFLYSSDDYLHFVIHTPFVEGDKHSVSNERHNC
jgi:mannose-6-phosphate isomerase-like protein (cupin superfamily)